MIEKLPTADTVELYGREAVHAMREHFGWDDEPTQPAPLELVVTPEAEFAERLRRAGLMSTEVTVW